MDLTGLGALFSGGVQGYQQGSDWEQQKRLREMQIQAAQRQQRGDAAGFNSLANLGRPMPQGPGQPSVPMQRPGQPPMQNMPIQSPQQGLAGAQGGGTPGGAPPGAGGPPGGQPAMPQQQPMPQQQGMLTIQQVAAKMRADNPGIDDETLFAGLVKVAPLLVPQDRQAVLLQQAQWKMETELSKLEERARQADQRNATQQDRIAMMGELGNLRVQIEGMRQKGMDDRQIKDQEERLHRLELTLKQKDDQQNKAEEGRNRRAMAKGDDQGVNQRLKAWAADARDYRDQIADLLHGRSKDLLSKEELAKFDQLTALRAQAAAKYKDVALKGGVKRPIDEAMKDPKLDDYGSETGGDAAAAPAGPKPGDVVDGYTFKGGDPAKAESWEQVKKPAGSGRR